MLINIDQRLKYQMRTTHLDEHGVVTYCDMQEGGAGGVEGTEIICTSVLPHGMPLDAYRKWIRSMVTRGEFRSATSNTVFFASDEFHEQFEKQYKAESGYSPNIYTTSMIGDKKMRDYYTNVIENLIPQGMKERNQAEIFGLDAIDKLPIYVQNYLKEEFGLDSSIEKCL